MQKILTRKDIDNMSEPELIEIINGYLDNLDENDVMRELINQDNMFQDVMKASEGKRTKPYIQSIIGKDFENIFEDEDNKMLKTIRNAQIMLLSENFDPKPHIPVIVRDTNNNKERQIIKPYFQDEQVVHHAIIRMILPKLQKGMYMYTCASIPGRGIHYARSNIKRIIEHDHKNTKFVLKMDIRKFFDSIPHGKLKNRIREIIKEPALRKIIFRIIDTTEKGLPLGFYTSQWLANWYLQPLDHYIKERILDDCNCNTKRTGRHGAVYYFRYMDDMVIFGPSKRELHKMKDQIEKVLKRDFGLKLKYDWQVFRFDYFDNKTGKRKGRPLDYVGFQFYHDHITIRKRTYKKIMKLIHKLRKMNVKDIPFHMAASMLSYYGFIYWSDAKGLYTKFLKPYVTLKDLKDIVRKEFQRKKDANGTDDLVITS